MRTRLARAIQRFFGGLWRDESGQSSFFAALTLFLLLAGIGYAYNVSLVVSRRVRLQNAADAAALSAATVEANALSAIAWLNGCQTYIHARMQEIMLDIPYPATAAATAEWGRYIMDRHGLGTLKENPVEMNHNTNKVGFIGGLWQQIKDTVGGLGGIFSNLGDNPKEYNEADKAKIESLLKEYMANGTSDERKKQIKNTLLNDYGINISGLDVTEEKVKEARENANKAAKEFEESKNTYLAESAKARAKFANSKFNTTYCKEGNTAVKAMFGDKGIDENIRNGLLENKDMSHYNDKNTYLYHGINLNAAIVENEKDIKGNENRIENLKGEIEVLKKKKKNNSLPPNTDFEKEVRNRENQINQLLDKNAGLTECNEGLEPLRDECYNLHTLVVDMADKGKKYKDAFEELKKLTPTEDNIKQDEDKAREDREKILKEWEQNNQKSPTVQESIEKSSLLNSPNDPPEPWALFKMIPIPLWNPFGPNIYFGRMSPLGTALSDVGIGGDHKEETELTRDNGLDAAIKKWAENKELKSGLPPWDELKAAFAGPFGQYLWPELMRIRYNLDSAPASVADFLGFFHNTLIKQAKRWIGYRRQDGSSLTSEGIRPGEQWIRQLSQISTAIASAMPALVRNEVLYSVAVNSSVKTKVAIFPDPDDIAKWGKVAFAQTDREAGESFFRYDGWFEPDGKAEHSAGYTWLPPPPYVNMYTFANQHAPAIRDAVRYNNKAVWKVDGQLYANRFLNESRRQNLRMRTESTANAGMDVVKQRIMQKVKSAGSAIETATEFVLSNVSSAVGEIFPVLGESFPALSYVSMVDDQDRVKGDISGWDGDWSRLGYFRMNHEKSFYWDEYAGRVGGWDQTDGPGSAVRVAVKGWNQNDRLWRQPVKDAPNNNKLLLGVLDGVTNLFTFAPIMTPFPYASGHFSMSNASNHFMSKSQLNFNLNPRCQTGYAPGSNVFGLGHPMFIPAHGNPADAFGAADGHWHFMHYHAHSKACQVGYPGLGACTAMINCIVVSLMDFFIEFAIGLGNDLGPVDRRTGYDSTIHFPYKHWDGTIVDDGAQIPGSTGGTAVDDAKKYHIYCRVSTGNKFEENFKLWNLIDNTILGHGAGRQPPFTIPLATGSSSSGGGISSAIMQLVPPLSLYPMVDKCPQIKINLIFFKITICKHILDHLTALGPGKLNTVGLHEHMTCGSKTNVIPKDAIPILNTPVLWNWGDMDPSIISMWGAQLTRGDMEGDFFMSLGSGDRFFYPEILYDLGSFLGSPNTNPTGRAKLFRGLNTPSAWAAELAGTLGNSFSSAANLDFVSGPGSALDRMTSGLGKLFSNFSDLLSGIDPLKNLDGWNPNYASLKNSLDMFKDSTFNEVFTSIADIITRWGHHRFMTCPLCMSYCPIGCDLHDGVEGYPTRHWGGDYGGADLFDAFPGKGASFSGVAGLYYKAIGLLSIMPGLLATGDQKSDAGMTYSNVLRGHDFSPPKTSGSDSFWYGRKGEDTKKTDIPHGASYFDLGVDLDDGLSGNGANPSLMREALDGKNRNTTRSWNSRFPVDRFVREWMTPREGSEPKMELAPTVVVTENFMRYGITVALVEEYVPALWMFGANRPMLAVATARCGFIERPDVYLGAMSNAVAIDGLGQGSARAAWPQIITGIGEPDGGAKNVAANGWDLDHLWDNFIDFPNSRPLGESNLYYGNWGAKLVPTRYGILTNARRDNTNKRRNDVNQIVGAQAAMERLWENLGELTCYRGDGAVDTAAKTLAQQCGMSKDEWRSFAREVVETAKQVESSLY